MLQGASYGTIFGGNGHRGFEWFWDTSLVLAGSDSDFNARHISERVPTTGGENPPNKQSHESWGGSLVLREYPQGVYRVYPLSWGENPGGFQRHFPKQIHLDRL